MLYIAYDAYKIVLTQYGLLLISLVIGYKISRRLKILILGRSIPSVIKINGPQHLMSKKKKNISIIFIN